MSDLHSVYAVLDRPGHCILRITEPISYTAALDIWDTLDHFGPYWHNKHTRCSAAHMPVKYFCVRSADDPNWPADAPCSTVRYINEDGDETRWVLYGTDGAVTLADFDSEHGIGLTASR